jgi:hypothetical protein
MLFNFQTQTALCLETTEFSKPTRYVIMFTPSWDKTHFQRARARISTCSQNRSLKKFRQCCPIKTKYLHLPTYAAVFCSCKTDVAWTTKRGDGQTDRQTFYNRTRLLHEIISVRSFWHLNKQNKAKQNTNPVRQQTDLKHAVKRERKREREREGRVSYPTDRYGSTSSNSSARNCGRGCSSLT